MKLITYELAGAVRLGLIDPQAGMVHPLSESETAFGNDMVALIKHRAAHNDSPQIESSGVAVENVKLLAPIPRPTKNIFCVGKNYYEYAQEFTQSGFDATQARVEYWCSSHFCGGLEVRLGGTGIPVVPDSGTHQPKPNSCTSQTRPD